MRLVKKPNRAEMYIGVQNKNLNLVIGGVEHSVVGPHLLLLRFWGMGSRSAVNLTMLGHSPIEFLFTLKLEFLIVV